MEFPAGFYITGLKGAKGNNLALITAPEGMRAAGVFTVNSCPAHPVVFSKKNIKKSMHRAILVNKGSANAATGAEGEKRLRELVGKVAKYFNVNEQEILTASTGVIGRQISFSEKHLNNLLSSHEKVDPYSFAEAIMTTDTHPKVAWSSFKLNGKEIKICGIAKGSGMIAPNMATMLSFILTDAFIEKKALNKAVKEAADRTFNRLNIDGETSTNDSVFLCSSGKAENRGIMSDGKSYESFMEHLMKVCTYLVEKLAADGEGATKMIKVEIKGAPDEKTARTAARAISSSPLCKTAFYGASPNWGRIVCAVGAKGIQFDMNKFSLYVNGVAWVKRGKTVQNLQEQLREVMSGSRYKLEVNFNEGNYEYYEYTCDLSPEYVRINAHYLS